MKQRGMVTLSCGQKGVWIIITTFIYDKLAMQCSLQIFITYATN